MIAATPQAALTIRNVLFATDFSPCSQRAMLHAVAVAHHYGATLHLAHVLQPALFSLIPPEGYAGTVEAEHLAMDLARSDAEKMVEEVLRKTECQLAHRTWVKLGVVGETLRAIIQREHIDLAVVGTHGRTGLRKIVMGSVAEEVFRHAPCPVVTVGPNSWRSDPKAVHLQRILFPTDFSPDSLRALPIALAIAEKFGAAVTVLHVVERLDASAAQDKPRLVAALEERMREMVASTGPMPPEITLEVGFGDVADTVLDVSDRLHVDLIAAGLKAPDSYADRVPWIHAYQVVCEAACPVLSLRGESSRD